MKGGKLISVLVLVAVSCSQPSPNIKTDLTEGWTFRQSGTEEWFPATVPGVVHTDLMGNEIIPDPWVGMNELDVQWIENEGWEYQATFDVNGETLRRSSHELVFEGLDTYADVYLNDSLILEADNMFRSWRVPVAGLLQEKENHLLVQFQSPIAINKEKVESLPYQLPASSEEAPIKVSPFTRKAPYHFGWDWGPRLVTSGIWRPVYLQSWDDVIIRDVQIKQLTILDEVANLLAVIEIESASYLDVEVMVMGQDSVVMLEDGRNEIVIPFNISNPKRWWPNGWGNPHLYDISVIMKKGGQVIDEDMVRTGLRTVELVQEQDSIGRSFYFKVNGEPLFARGANYIPQSHFLPSVKDEDYQALTGAVKDANINMLRVWGGGIYENDIFYELCDENGILVWQDFMFANTMYPGNGQFMNNVKKEVIDNVKRLRNHPSIVHWNGNNEIEVAWKNWGWQGQYGYSKADSTKLWEDYLALFHEQIPEWLAGLDDRSYTTTSPLSNWGTPENFNYGSMHYWGVWHGDDDFEDYNDNVGRFMSEYGFQSFPDKETVAYYADSSNWSLDAEVMKHHQKSYRGNGLIEKQATKYFGKPLGFDDFLKKSQLTQTKAMQMAIDVHRLNKGHCWGSLFWQLNDCWPGPSWSAIDVFGRRKVFYEDLKTLFAPLAVIPKVNEDQIELTIINDTLEDFEGLLQVSLHTPSGNIIREEMNVFVKRNGVRLLASISNMGFSTAELTLFQDGEKVFERREEI
ncbi:glycosyl hydrolase 2 galactose-binding domain-containing protein [Ekhidna sp.]|uniref:glycoside hydrolase family 2 protein n=1 Tax=Ekhidna sp. TaxID=2608089 RepID=UPI003B59D143